MDVKIHTVHIDLADSQRELIIRKFNKFDRLRDYISSMDLFVKQDDVSVVMELKILVPGKSIIVKEKGKTVEEVVDKVVRNGLRQIKRYKEQLTDRR